VRALAFADVSRWLHPADRFQRQVGSAEGEGDRQTAVRETLEESGLRLNRGDLRELGRFAYRPDKALLLYAVLMERLDTRLLTCSSQYRDQRGGKCCLKWMPSGDTILCAGRITGACCPACHPKG